MSLDHVSARACPRGCISEFTLRLNKGHLYGHAFGVGQNRSERADLNLQPAPALLPHAELVAQLRDVDRQAFEGKRERDGPTERSPL